MRKKTTYWNWPFIATVAIGIAFWAMSIWGVIELCDVIEAYGKAQ